jgi:hypothetical protein
MSTLEQDVELGLAALDAIRNIIALIDGAHAGTVTPEDALSMIKIMSTGIANNDAAAEKALDAKFDLPGTVKP